jgi:ABC-type glycerol-3-phosphate transport system permease component
VAVTSFKSDFAVASGPRTTRPASLAKLDFNPTLDAWVFIFSDREDNLLPRYLNSTLIALVATGFTLLFGGMATFAKRLLSVPVASAIRYRGAATTTGGRMREANMTLSRFRFGPV